MTLSRRHVGSWLALVLLTAAGLEAVGYAGLWLVPSPETAGEGPAAGDREAQAIAIAPYLADEMLHPFVGYVWNPEIDRPALRGVSSGLRVSPFGFIDDDDSRPVPSPDTAIVAVTGGSFAGQLAIQAREPLRARLARLPQMAGRRIRIVSLALGGYKQPQQLFAVSYMLAAGAGFDVVINVDGFNEVALNATDNIPGGVSVLYPRAWPYRVSSLHAEHAALTGKIAYLRERRARVVAFVGRSPWRYSATARLAARVVRRGLSGEIDALQGELVHSPGAAVGAAATGPPVEGGNTLASAVETWRRSSRLLSRLCAANGIAYFHFLQPNLHVPGTKPLTAEERALLSPPHPYRQGVVEGYPGLVAGGAALAASGVAFADLSGVLARNPETLYADGCCHLTTRGYEIVAVRMASFIEERGLTVPSRLSSR